METETGDSGRAGDSGRSRRQRQLQVALAVALTVQSPLVGAAAAGSARLAALHLSCVPARRRRPPDQTSPARSVCNVPDQAEVPISKMN